MPENGGPVTYTVDITNTSETDSITLDTITDSVDGGAAVAVDGTCDDLIGTSLAPGASTSCTFTMTVSGNAGDVVDDTVTVSGGLIQVEAHGTDVLLPDGAAAAEAG